MYLVTIQFDPKPIKYLFKYNIYQEGTMSQ